MPRKDFTEKASGQNYSEQIQVAEHGLEGDSIGVTKNLTFIIAICWSLFQLMLAVIIVDSTYSRAIHLAFAMALVYLNIPMLKKYNSRRWDLRILLAMNRVTILDYILGILACFAALYIVFDYTGLAERVGDPILRDFVFGLILITLLLEATRRVIGPSLPCIAILFIIYLFLGPHLPNFLAFKGTSLSRFISQMTMGTEGIYGIPLEVSSSVVFLFVLFGSMLERAGGGSFFIKLALSVLGRFRGGAAKAAVLGSALTGMVSGSSIANVVTTGTFTIPLMKKMGYPAHKAAAIEVAASVNGQLAPPVMGAAAFIIAEYVNIPYLEVAKAAAIPAFAAYVALLWVTHVEACKLGIKGLSKKDIPPFWGTLREGLHFLIPIGMLLYELTITQRSAESAVFRTIVVLTIIMLFDKPIRAYIQNKSLYAAFKESLKDIFISLASGARNMAGVAMATAAAGIIVGAISLGIGGQITTFVEQIANGNIFLLLTVTAMASLLLGMGLPTTANYIIMASLTAPLIVHLSAGLTFFGLPVQIPLLAAHLFCFYFGILADDTPPVGLAAYAAAAIGECSPITTGIQGFLYDMRTAILPFMFVFNSDIILHNINNLPLAILIFLMSCLGTVAFASLVQRWLICKTNIWETLLLAVSTIMLLFPELLTYHLSIPHRLRHLGYIVGLIALLLAVILQKSRTKKHEVVNATTL